MLAGHVAGVGHGHVDGEGVRALLDREVGVGKGGVGHARAKRVGHDLGVIEVTGVALAQNLILVAGLVVAIAHIDALGVDVLVAPVIAVELVGGPLVAVGRHLVQDRLGDLGEIGVDAAEVGHSGNGLVVLVNGVGKAAGGVDGTGQDIDEHRGAGKRRGVAGGGDVAKPQQRINGVRPLAVGPADVVGSGHANDHLREGAGTAHLGDAVEHLLLFGGKGQVVVVLVPLGVATLVVTAADEDQGDAVGVSKEARGLDVRPGVLVDLPGVHVLGAVGVELKGSGIEVEASGGHDGVEVGHVGGRVAKDNNLAVRRGDRQCSALVAQKDDALAHCVCKGVGLIGHELGLSLEGIGVVALVVLVLRGGRGGGHLGFRLGRATAARVAAGEAREAGHDGGCSGAQDKAPACCIDSHCLVPSLPMVSWIAMLLPGCLSGRKPAGRGAGFR